MNDNPALKITLDSLKQTPGEDRILISTTPVDRGLTVRLQLEAGVVKVIGEAARMLAPLRWARIARTVNAEEEPVATSVPACGERDLGSRAEPRLRPEAGVWSVRRCPARPARDYAMRTTICTRRSRPAPAVQLRFHPAPPIPRGWARSYTVDANRLAMRRVVDHAVVKEAIELDQQPPAALRIHDPAVDQSPVKSRWVNTSSNLTSPNGSPARNRAASSSGQPPGRQHLDQFPAFGTGNSTRQAAADLPPSGTRKYGCSPNPHGSTR